MARPRKRPTALTQLRLVGVLKYDPQTGAFAWRADGRSAGCVRANGYVVIKVDGEEHPAHRLAWLYVTGKWPEAELDHKNCIKTDNRFENLREASSSQNIWNRPMFRNNTSGAKGVFKDGNKWRVRIAANGIRHSLGRYDSFEAAEAVYRAAAEREFGEFARLA